MWPKEASKAKHEFNKKKTKARKEARTDRKWREQENAARPWKADYEQRDERRTQNRKEARQRKETLRDEEYAFNGLDHREELSAGLKSMNAQGDDDTDDVKEKLSSMTIQP